MKHILTLTLAFGFLFIIKVGAQPSFPKNAKEAELVSTDILNFIDAYKALKTNSDTIETIQTLYLDKATPGLKEYIARFNLSANAISQAIQKYPEEYKKIEKFYRQMAEIERVFLDQMETYKKVIPQAMFPPTYLLIADYSGIGQASKTGQLISIERKCVDDIEQLKNLIVHELTHFQQAVTMGMAKYISIYAKKDNLLDVVLREGGAEFITFKLVRKREDQFKKLHDYEKNELAYWERFKTDLKNQDSTFWLNAKHDNDEGIPVQLGYGLGYKIVEAYYNQAADKTKALLDILLMEDANVFFEKSNYKPE
jgi:uncharacterized protein YjaZ